MVLWENWVLLVLGKVIMMTCFQELGKVFRIRIALRVFRMYFR